MHLLIVDDHPLFREALAGIVGRAYPDAVIHEAGGIAGACAILTRERAMDLVLLDLSMQGIAGLDGLVALRKGFPRAPILVVSGLDDPRLGRDALAQGAAGFVPKAADRETLTRAIASVLAGDLSVPTDHAASPMPTGAVGGMLSGKTPLSVRLARLTPQQVRVLAMIRQGLLNKQIAHALQVGDSTVKAHVSEILRKLEVISRTQAVIETASLDFNLIARGSGR